MPRDAAHPLDGSGNLRSIVAILAATVFFTVVDVMMKLASANLPVGECIVIRNGIATALVSAYAIVAGELRYPRDAPAGPIALRMIGEGGSTIAFLSALAVMPIADAAGIGQFGPLAIMAAAALYLGEPIGWRRWLATLAGFLGVMLIIRPGTAAFSAPGLLVLLAVILNVVRDFATRAIGVHISTVTLTVMSSAATLAAGLLMLPFETWVAPSPLDVLRLSIAGLFLLGGYAAMIITMRHGQVSAATPFRYSGMALALLVGWLIWNEIPDWLSLTGIAIVCVAGAYSLQNERR